MDWISVEDELPERRIFTSGRGWSRRVDVLFCDARGRMSVGYCEENGRFTMAKAIGAVTHWMPLPDPPKAASPSHPQPQCASKYHDPAALYCLQCLPDGAPVTALLVGTRPPTKEEIKAAPSVQPEPRK